MQSMHCTNGNAVYTNPRRFQNLIKTLLIPILEYPPIPICSTSLKEKRNLQTVLNKALKLIDCNKDNEAALEQLHIKYDTTPLNISIDKKGRHGRP